MNIPTVYTKPGCVQCDATTRALRSRKIDHQTVDLTEDDEALSKIKAMGYVQAPVVVTEDDHWSGFRPDKIKALHPCASRGQVGLDSPTTRRIAL